MSWKLLIVVFYVEYREMHDFLQIHESYINFEQGYVLLSNLLIIYFLNIISLLFVYIATSTSNEIIEGMNLSLEQTLEFMKYKQLIITTLLKQVQKLIT